MSVWRTVNVTLEFSAGCEHAGSVKENRRYSCDGQTSPPVQGELGYLVNDAGSSAHFSRVECFVDIDNVPKMLRNSQQFRLEVGPNEFYVPVVTANSSFVLDLPQPVYYGYRIGFGLTNEGGVWKKARVRLHFIN
jgi:hypothetical protein